jgi:hypothetical protein
MQPDRQRIAVKSRQQLILALELRASGASFEQIGKALDPPVSRERAHKIVMQQRRSRTRIAKLYFALPNKESLLLELW